jgi:hypothetical protein
VEVVEVDVIQTLQSETERVAAVAEEVPNITELVQEVHQQLVRGPRAALDLSKVRLAAAVVQVQLVPMQQTRSAEMAEMVLLILFQGHLKHIVAAVAVAWLVSIQGRWELGELGEVVTVAEI